jgi:hypothetical protein
LPSVLPHEGMIPDKVTAGEGIVGQRPPLPSLHI